MDLIDCSVVPWMYCIPHLEFFSQCSPQPLTSGANSPVSHSPRTTVPSGLSTGRLLAFLSQRGGLSHCSLGLSLFWPGRVGVIGCTGECRLPHDPRVGLICNYLLQCSGRLQFALVQDVDYLVYWDGRVVFMRVHKRAGTSAHTSTRTHSHSETLMSFHSPALDWLRQPCS